MLNGPTTENMKRKYKSVAQNDTSYWILQILISCLSISVKNIL